MDETFEEYYARVIVSPHLRLDVEFRELVHAMWRDGYRLPRAYLRPRG